MGGAAGAAARDEPVLALICVAMFGLVVSPVSWSHHWVWALPTVLVTRRAGLPAPQHARLGAVTAVGVALMVWTPITLMPEHRETDGIAVAPARRRLLRVVGARGDRRRGTVLPVTAAQAASAAVPRGGRSFSAASRPQLGEPGSGSAAGSSYPP